MVFKFLKKASVFTLLTFSILPLTLLAYSTEIIPGGENIGIELKSKGVMIVGVYEVNNTYPAREAGINVGDIITAVNNKNISSIDEMVDEIENAGETKTVNLTYKRNNVIKTTTMSLYKDNNVYKTGLYVKDSITGIGTLTFIDPNTKLFGALGHEITEKTTGKILEIKDGKIFDSKVTDIDRSEAGTPGEKNAEFYFDKKQGSITENTDKGIFGTYTKDMPNKKMYKVAEPIDIKIGNATIRTVLKNNEIKEYKINIYKLNKDQKTKNIMFKIEDQNLLNQTGGIIQGMSGSPIIQGEYIIGAVTHVVIDDPTKGYGIFITNMLEEAEN